MSKHQDILGCIGRTPVLALPRLSRSAGATLLGKAELFNPGGSLKDRIALAMIEAAEAAGELSPGATIVEATAGNTGLGLAWVTAALGYRFVAVMSEADRGPKTETMEAMGTEVELVRTGVAWDSEEGPLGVAARIAAERGGLFINQFANPANPDVHQHQTAAEILEQVGEDLDAVVVGVGTGGTATGLARGLVPSLPRLRMIGVVADGAYLGSGREDDRIAGITPDFEPSIFALDLLDEVQAIPAGEAARATRRLAEVEGIPAGHSSGACLLAAENEARRHPGSTILLLLGDSIRNYPGIGRSAPNASPCEKSRATLAARGTKSAVGSFPPRCPFSKGGRKASAAVQDLST